MLNSAHFVMSSEGSQKQFRLTDEIIRCLPVNTVWVAIKKFQIHPHVLEKGWIMLTPDNYEVE